MRPPYSGQCLCGGTQYRVSEEPIMVYACHCTDCQKRSGSSFGLSVWVPRAAIEVTKGSAEAHTTTSVEGKVQHIRACGQCRTRLWTEPAKRPNVGIVRGGTLDDTSWLQPVAHIWTRSAQPWFVFPEGITRYETQPAAFDDVAGLWRKYRERLDG
jgi:hypothetical protein